MMEGGGGTSLKDISGALHCHLLESLSDPLPEVPNDHHTIQVPLLKRPFVMRPFFFFFGGGIVARGSKVEC